MPYAERLPSGKYRAMYRTKEGKKLSAGTFKHKRMAENKAAAAEEEARSPGWRDPAAAGRLWGDWCSEWWDKRDVEDSTLKRELTMRKRHIDPYWNDVALGDITRHDIRAWAVGLAKEQGVAMSTAKRISNILSASLSAAVDKEILDVNPAARLGLTRVDVDNNRYLSHAEADRLLEQFQHPVDRGIVSTLLGSGLRWGEMNGLRVQRLNLDRGVIRVAEVWDSTAGELKAYPKGRRFRTVPIPEWLVDRLAPLVEGRTTGYVFEKDGYMLRYSNWRKKYWLPSLDLSGLGDLRIHDLRHTYASWLIQRGYTLAEIGQLLGHESPSTTQIYAHLVDDIDSDKLRRALPEVGARISDEDAA